MVRRMIVAGGVNMDLHLFRLSCSSGHAPLVADRYLAQPGGTGAQVARAAARLDADVSLIGRVGNTPLFLDPTPPITSAAAAIGQV